MMMQEDVWATIDAVPVCSRPAKVAWVFVAFFTVMGGLSLSLPWMEPRSREVGALMASGFMASFFLIPALVCAVWTARGRIIADDWGLRWRGLGRWRSAEWDNVQDYYDKLPSKSNRISSGPEMVVETSAGRLTFSREWTPHQAIRDVIEQRATCARAKSWGVKGTRPEDDWPHVFHYDTRDNRTTLWVLSGCLLLLYGMMLGRAIPKTVEWVRELGWGLGLAPVLVMLILLFTYSLMFWVGAFLPLEAKQRKHQRITVSLSHLRYEDTGRTFEIAWRDVSDYFLASFPAKIAPGYLYRVVTNTGSFDFTAALSEASLLRIIIPLYATGAKTKQWRSHDDFDLLGGQRSRWSGGCEGVGERVFHYRTRTNRALLWLFAFFALIPLIPFAVDPWLGLPIRDDTGAILTTCALMGAAWLWTFWRYQTARVLIDSRGIIQNTMQGTRCVAWDEVQDYYKSGSDMFIYGNIVSTEGRVRFWLGIADAEELQDEIARRAVHSQSREWKEAKSAKEEAEGVPAPALRPRHNQPDGI